MFAQNSREHILDSDHKESVNCRLIVSTLFFLVKQTSSTGMGMNRGSWEENVTGRRVRDELQEAAVMINLEVTQVIIFTCGW